MDPGPGTRSGRGVLLVCGSLRRVSANAAVLDVVDRHLTMHDVKGVRSLSVGDIEPFDPDREAQAGAAVRTLRSQIETASAVVISTPEYAGALPGALKNALDWVVGSGELVGMPVALVSAGTTGGEHARAQLVRTLTWQGAHVVAHLGIAGPRTKSAPDGTITDRATIADLEALTQRLIDFDAMSAVDRSAAVTDILGGFGIGVEHVSPIRDGPTYRSGV